MEATAAAAARGREAADAAPLTLLSPPYADRVRGALLGAFCGDALGAAVEGWTAEQVAAEHEEGACRALRSRRRSLTLAQLTSLFPQCLCTQTSLPPPSPDRRPDQDGAPPARAGLLHRRF